MKENKYLCTQKLKYVIFMKKVILSFFLTAFTVVNASAQNFQLHYDFGRHIYSTEEKGRQDVTATFEHFSADDLGSWFYFVDLDLDKDGVMGAYTEVSREFNFAKATESSSFAAHVEFDGGMEEAVLISRQPSSVVPGTVIMQISPLPIPFRLCTSSSSSSQVAMTHTLHSS